MLQQEVMIPVDVVIEQGERPEQLVFSWPASAALRERYQLVLEAELSGYPKITSRLAYAQRFVVNTSSASAAADPELRELIVGKIREIFLRASLGR